MIRTLLSIFMAMGVITVAACLLYLAWSWVSTREIRKHIKASRQRLAELQKEWAEEQRRSGKW